MLLNPSNSTKARNFWEDWGGEYRELEARGNLSRVSENETHSILKRHLGPNPKPVEIYGQIIIDQNEL